MLQAFVHKPQLFLQYLVIKSSYFPLQYFLAQLGQLGLLGKYSKSLQSLSGLGVVGLTVVVSPPADLRLKKTQSSTIPHVPEEFNNSLQMDNK